MNLEFHSAGNPAMNGLLSLAPKAENIKLQQPVRGEKSAHFKELLNQSKSDIKEAENQTKTENRNPKSENALEAVDQTENDQTSEDLVTEKTEQQADNTLAEAIKEGGNQENNLGLVLESGQFNVVQKFQGGLDSARSKFNIKLNMDLENNEIQADVTNQKEQGQVVSVDNQIQASQVFDIATQSGNVLVQEDANGAISVNGSEIPLKKAADNNPNINPEAIVEKQDQKSSPIKNQVLNGQDNQKVDLINEALINSVKPQKIDSPGIQEMGDSGKVQVNEEKPEKIQLQNDVDKTQTTQTLNVAMTTQISGEVLKDSDGQVSITTLSEDVIIADRGIQGNPSTGINPTKGTEGQANTNVPVSQQVEQKILQNFEVNKPIVFQMTLSPENLGDIDVQLKYDQGKLIIDIMALSKETQNLLGKEINQLVRSLALQNVKVESVNLNTPVEANSSGQNSASLMNSGSDFTQQQNNARLRENFARNSYIQKSLSQVSEEDVIQGVAQNLQFNGYRRINYLI